MSEKSNDNVPVQQGNQKESKPEWYDFIVKIVEDLLEFNMHVYKKEKAQRL